MFPTPDFIANVSADLKRDLLAFLPELIICGTLVVMLLMRMFASLSRVHLGIFALTACAAALVAAIGFWPQPYTGPGPVPGAGGAAAFSGLLVFDTFGLYVRAFLLLFACLALWLSLVTGIPDREDSADYSTLLLGATLGMMLMASANHLLMAFIAVEMASLPSYALAGFLKGRRRGSEAALKYVVYGASASGVMLYGISLIAGAYGTGSLPAIAQAIDASGETPSLPVVVGMLCVVVGLGFKLSAVPFHFWCPDVFEGAAAEVAAFLSVASKSAALALSARFLVAMVAADANGAEGLFGSAVAIAWALFAALTATFGNLAALAQTNIKRILAYSTIAHAGIMMMALTPIGPRVAGPLLFYIGGYLLMNLGAFAIVALVRNRTGSEEIDAYRGLVRRSPLLAVAMAFFLLSLLGMPPLVGFAAKFQVFAVLYELGSTSTGAESEFMGWVYLGLLGIAALNTAVSAGYYLRVVRAMTLEEPADGSAIEVTWPGRMLIVALAAGTLAAGIFWAPLNRVADQAGKSFAFTFPAKAETKK